ncbi:hypothetical protein Cpin_1344 [Chitinophaga pinensis DSM 2588]|uniref:Uncharacterized protein n=1 Tax=Chitinophaga pinensis (strain ATCC 43595 / DSM 2588 / LMG 13176 / NBRC 15968 / NCIMB 11800 / UQM 2034) TaxID=485918 RepID=A0A979G142_CHIPD|nr:hypothetical protein Cpin_1344 [Chitinophaga pinensis DSM 2588]
MTIITPFPFVAPDCHGPLELSYFYQYLYNDNSENLPEL